MSVVLSYPEGAVGDIDFAPGDNDCVFDGFCGNVNTEVGAISVISDLHVNREAVGVLRTQTRISYTCSRKKRVLHQVHKGSQSLSFT